MSPSAYLSGGPALALGTRLEARRGTNHPATQLGKHGRQLTCAQKVDSHRESQLDADKTPPLQPVLGL